MCLLGPSLEGFSRCQAEVSWSLLASVHHVERVSRRIMMFKHAKRVTSVRTAAFSFMVKGIALDRSTMMGSTGGKAHARNLYTLRGCSFKSCQHLHASNAQHPGLFIMSVRYHAIMGRSNISGRRTLKRPRHCEHCRRVWVKQSLNSAFHYRVVPVERCGENVHENSLELGRERGNFPRRHLSSEESFAVNPNREKPSSVGYHYEFVPRLAACWRYTPEFLWN